MTQVRGCQSFCQHVLYVAPENHAKITKFKKIKDIPNKNFLKCFLPLTATVFFLLKMKKNKSQ